MEVETIEDLINRCYETMEKASRDRLDAEEADKAAALFLVAQMRLSSLIEEIEIKAKGSKNDISKIEAEKYFEYKINNSDKKITENMMTSFVAKDTEVLNVKSENVKQEANLKKWNFVFNTLKDGHVFFRNIGKNKTWNE